MKKALIMAWCLSFFLLQNTAFSTMPHPSPQQEENLTKKFNLNNTDKIILKYKEFTNEITDKADIGKILNGFSKLSTVILDQYKPEGELVFYSGDKESLRMGLSFFEYSPEYVLGSNCYMYGKEADDVVIKYMPSDFKKNMNEIIELRSKGTVY